MIAKGHIDSLNIPAKGRQRILVGISWDPRAKKTTVMDKLRGTNQQHDLDLSCYMYDDQREYIDYVGSMAQDSMDQTGSVYHSGDDNTGEGIGDDEVIAAELGGLPYETEHLVFVSEIRSDHTFADVDAPYAHVSDSMTHTNLLEVHMAADAAGKAGKACVLAVITRDSDSPSGWSARHIDEYPPLADISDWGSYLKRYI
jgi:stress response protein SCP2